MMRRLLISIMLAAAFSLILAIPNFADTVYIKDGRVIKGNLQEETKDYIVIFEPDTLWRVGIYKRFIDRVERNGIIYKAKPGEMMRPIGEVQSEGSTLRREKTQTPAVTKPAASTKPPVSAKPAASEQTAKPTKEGTRTEKPQQNLKNPEEEGLNPIADWFRRLFGGSSK